ncbi:18738_t:CDS:2 [Gigaspora margarita]|uniref:18738_t:CDS:1 n=1 Tax=Gigaspora margarita TaxID=4874 RepID=A0ABN7V1D9_GIGMA|nr:18738_t:CDS:2 [Gigaspora margarita]
MEENTKREADTQIPIYKNKNAPESDIPGNSSGSDESNNVLAKEAQSNSDAYQETGTLSLESNKSQCSTSPICTKSKSL